MNRALRSKSAQLCQQLTCYPLLFRCNKIYVFNTFSLHIWQLICELICGFKSIILQKNKQQRNKPSSSNIGQNDGIIFRSDVFLPTFKTCQLKFDMFYLFQNLRFNFFCLFLLASVFAVFRPTLIFPYFMQGFTMGTNNL